MSSNFKMGPLQRKWIEELKTTDKQQIEGYLCTDDGRYCCLGILCEVLNLDKRVTHERVDCDSFVVEFYSPNSKVMSDKYQLPQHVHSIVNLSDELGRVIKHNVEHVTTEDGYNCLADMNDSGISFKEIAEIIEVDPSNFFTKSA